MSADRWLRLRELYDALSHVSPAERERLLNELCADPELRTDVLALLAADQKPDPFLNRTARRSARLRPGAVLCDRFVIQRILGKGGMGEVWAARDRQLEEDVAIKTIRPSQVNEAGGIARFKREIQLARRIAHPNVCRVHELFEDATVTPPRLFLTMELLEGQTLSERLFEDGPLSTDAALEIVRQIAAGLAAAHQAGVVHRDLKPSNIMITAGASPGRVVLMDFGLARGPDKSHPAATTQVGALMGTPEYMAPEQISGGTPTPATDIYALGLILFEMLRGKPPFAADTTLESWMRRAREGPERLSGVVPGVQARIDSVIARCLEYEPAKRFQNAREVWDALQSPWPAVVARSRWPVVGAAAVLVAVLVGLGAWSVVDRFRGGETPPAEALQWYEEAQRALAEGASVRALNAVTRALAIAPRFPAAHAAHAEILLELDMPGRAQEAMLRATELAPNRSRLSPEDAAYLDGMQQLLLRNCDAAIGSLQRVANAARVPDRPYRLISVARAMARCGQSDQALATFVEVAHLDASNAAARLWQSRLLARVNDIAAATNALNAAETLFRDRNNSQGVAEVLVARATLATERDQLKDATAILEKASELANGLDDVRQQIRVRLQQAIVHRKEGELSAAEKLTADALNIARRHSLETLTLDGLFTSANVHIVQQQLSEARELIERALMIAENYRHDEYRARAHLSLATIWTQLSEPSRADEAIRAARSYYEPAGDVRNLAIADALTGQTLIMRARYEEARDRFTRSLREAETTENADQEAAARQNLATVLALVGRYGDALGEYTRLVEMRRAAGRRPAEAYARLNSADMLGRLGRFREASAAVADARRVGAGNRDVTAQLHRVRAALALREGKYADALSEARLALAAASGQSERIARASQNVCVAEAALGRRDEALRSCDALVQAYGASDHVTIAIETLLAAAEAYLLLGERDLAISTIDRVAPLLDAVGDYHERWKLLAIHRAVRPSDGSAEDKLTHELDRLRLSWKEADFVGWQRRADVRGLLTPSRELR